MDQVQIEELSQKIHKGEYDNSLPCDVGKELPFRLYDAIVARLFIVIKRGDCDDRLIELLTSSDRWVREFAKDRAKVLETELETE